MSGIFGVIARGVLDRKSLRTLALHIRRRGFGRCGLAYSINDSIRVVRARQDVMELLRKEQWSGSNFVLGYSGKRSCGLQPIVQNGLLVLHSGLILNDTKRGFEASDSNLISDMAGVFLQNNCDLADLPQKVLGVCEGMVSAVVLVPDAAKVVLFSNHGSLFVGTKNGDVYFASERYPLEKIDCDGIVQVSKTGLVIDVPRSQRIEVAELSEIKQPVRTTSCRDISKQEKMLQFHEPHLRRCTKCILPETMPFISFDSDGVCNYCRNYKIRNEPKPKEQLLELVKPYRRSKGPECIVPFSGGRDSCYALHVTVNELKLKPIAYTYDWGMITEVGYRNVSRMCAELGVENIVIAADIEKKIGNIRKNLKAWLRAPHLGMISILTAGDKHFFRYVDTVKKETGIRLNLWGVNPLEVTYFKAGFLGIKPDFEETRVYSSGVLKQLRYQSKRFRTMLQSPGYFNSSLWDTLSGEYYRSFAKKSDYFHIYDYWRWDERLIEEVLRQYNWEFSEDTSTSWRIGDGTAALYNYIYYTVAGFTEHDTFRSNQIREGQITRDEALRLVREENKPRFESIRWYLDLLGIDFVEAITVVNSIPKLFKYED